MAGLAANRRVWVECAAVAGALAGALGLRAAFSPVLGQSGIYFTVLVATLLLGWWRGARVAAPALVIGWIASIYLFAEPPGRLMPTAEGEWLRAILALTVGALAVVVSEHTHRALARARQTRAEGSLLASIVENSDDAIVSKRLDGTITSWNSAAERIFGWPADEIIGRSITTIIPPERLGEEAQIIAQIIRGQRVDHFETERITKDGRHLDVSLTISPIRDQAGRIVGASKIARDVTLQRETQAQLRHYRENLESLVAERTAALEQVHRRARLTERLAALGTLAAGLGHDVANLLLPVRARLDLLEAGDLPDGARADLAAVRGALEYLQRLSTGMRLLAADTDSPGADGSITDLASWWNDAESVLRTVLPRGVSMRCRIEPGAAVAMPRHHLTQAVFNLVQNAGEALSQRGRGAVAVSARRGESGGLERPVVEVCISDDGPGMSPQVLSRCFEPYFSTKGRSISTGMGLALVRGLVERCGGTIGVESVEGRGTTFTMRLPAAEEPTDALPRRLRSVVWSEGGRTALLAATILESLGVSVARGEAPGESDVWVVGSDGPDVEAFVLSAPGRCAVVCDEGPPADALEGRLIYAGRSPRAAELRRALARAVSRAEGAREAMAGRDGGSA